MTSVSVKDRRLGTQSQIDKLLTERQELLVLYERVAGVKPFGTGVPSRDLLAQFSQVLVDYIAAGHFGLYERIVTGKERRQGVKAVAERLYPKISESTEKAIAFNDAFDSSLPDDEFSPELSQALSELGESIASRIEHEDELIRAVLGTR